VGGGVVLIIAYTADCRPHNALSGALWRFLSGAASTRAHKGYRPVAKILTRCYIVPDNYEAIALRGAR